MKLYWKGKQWHYNTQGWAPLTPKAKGRKQSIQSTAQEHNFPIDETKQKLLKDGKNLNQRVCCRYFGSQDLLTNQHWRATHWIVGRMNGLDLHWSYWLEAALILRKRRHCCIQREYLLTELWNVTVNLQKRESSIVGFAPRISTIRWLLWG